MFEELTLIRNALIRVFAAFVLLMVGFLMVPVPYLGSTVTEAFVQTVRVSILPAGSTLSVTNPLDPFLTQGTVAAAFALALLFPLFFWEFWRFVSPGLMPRERRALAGGLVAALVLAALGGLFAYTVLIPVIFGELYAFLPSGVVAYFSLREVVSLVTGFVIGCALIFLLPLVMALLSFVGLVPARAWRDYARFAVLLVLILSAIITPDGSGVGMLLLSLPVCALYGAGYAASTLAERKHPLLGVH